MPKPKPKLAAPANKIAGAKAKPRAARRRSACSADEVREIFRRFSVQRPDPRGELDYINPYTLLVAVVLSAQATDVSVNKATEPLFKIVDTPQKMLKLGEAKLKDYIKTIGLYNTKAKNVIELSRILIEKFGGEVPEDRETLQT